ncbi:MAG: SH3 domain-containing protein [Chloroflexales bacterium]|nr:SH3 domain-containing protein [Chloroflexales bacterium]
MEFWLPLILIGVVVIVMVALGVVLRRRRAAAAAEPPEIGSPMDYTSLPIEEPTGWRDRFNNLSLAGKALLVLVPLLVIVGGIVLVLALATPPAIPVETAVATPPPAPEITITNARVINPQTIAIRADSTLPPDTPVEATLLANNEPFAWFDPSTASAKAGPKGEIDVRLTKIADAPGASSEVSYTVALKAQIDGKAVEAASALSVPSTYARSFYELPVAVAPTAAPEEPTAAPEEPTAAPEEPTATPEAPPVAALTGSVFNGGNVRDQPRVTGSTVLDQVNAGENVQLLQKTTDGRWYQIQNIRGVVGWVSVTLLNPIAPEAASQVPAQGNPALPTAVAFATADAATPAAPNATPTTGQPLPTLPAGLAAGVFNGGNVRNQPRVSGSTVLDQINAGENVQLLQKIADGSWYQIRNQRAVVGWVNATLLTIDPTVAAKVPVAPAQ